MTGKSQPLTTERLEQIRATDEGVGPDLRFCPPAWLERRELLQHIAALDEARADHDRLVRELDVLLNGDEAAPAPSLCDIVAQIRHIQRRRYETQQAIAEALAPQDATPCQATTP